MSITGLGIRSPWRPLEPEAVRRLEAATGVYELRPIGGGPTERFAMATARSAFGLRGELSALIDETADAAATLEFRSEVTSTYHTRWRELLGRHLAVHGDVPPGNRDDRPARLNPIGAQTP